MKFLHYTDIHIYSPKKTPSWVVQNYKETILASLNFAYATARARGVTTVLHSGDFFHTPIQPPHIERAVIEILNRYPEIRTIGIPGQHDTQGHISSEWAKYSLSVVAEACNFEVLCHGQYADVVSSEGEKYRVYGYSYGDKELEELYETANYDVDQAYYNIALVHDSVGPQGWGGKSPDSINIRGFKLALFGDIHIGFPPTEMKSGCIGWNPGSVTKGSRKELGVVPQLSYIEVDGPPSKATVDLEFIPVPYPSDEDLYLPDDAKITDSEGRTAGFLAEYGKIARGKDESVIDQLKRVAEVNNIPTGSVKRVVGALPK